ncbi:hypothetical protein ACHAQH_001226 [Verticillium albo-atrum]
MLNSTVFRTGSGSQPSQKDPNDDAKKTLKGSETFKHEDWPSNDFISKGINKEAVAKPPLYQSLEPQVAVMRRTGSKITQRTQAIVEEYDSKIRDCTMRIDGMAMATQWVIAGRLVLRTVG